MKTSYLTVLSVWQVPVVERRIELVEMKPRVFVEGCIETTISRGIFCFPSTFGLDTAELHRLLDQRNTLEQSVS